MYLALLFVIILLYLYETYTDIKKLQSKKEGFTNYKNHNELYNKHRDYFNRLHLVQEGARRNQIKEQELQRLKNKLRDPTLTEIEIEEIEAELKGNAWREYAFQRYDPRGEKRMVNDFITDYNPNIIGCPRPWMECHTYQNVRQIK